MQIPLSLVAGSLGEEGEAVAVRVGQEELPASGAILAGFGRRGESVREYGAVEVVDVVDLEVERRSWSGLAVVVGREGDPEPVDVAGDLVVIALARPEAQVFVELGGPVEI